MIDIREAFRLIDEMADEKERHQVINIDAIIETNLDKDFLSGNLEDRYDEQTLDEWYDFAIKLESVIDRTCEIVNESNSKNPSSISGFIDFYILDKNGNRMNYLIDFRLSDHPATGNDKSIRRRKAEKIDSNPQCITVTFHDNITEYKSYDEVVEYIKDKILQVKKGEIL